MLAWVKKKKSAAQTTTCQKTYLLGLDGQGDGMTSFVKHTSTLKFIVTESTVRAFECHDDDFLEMGNLGEQDTSGALYTACVSLHDDALYCGRIHLHFHDISYTYSRFQWACSHWDRQTRAQTCCIDRRDERVREMKKLTKKIFSMFYIANIFVCWRRTENDFQQSSLYSALGWFDMSLVRSMHDLEQWQGQFYSSIL